MQRYPHWERIAETGTTIGMHIVVFVMRFGGLPVARILIYPIISFYFLLRGDARAASRDYLARVQPHTAVVKGATLGAVFRHFIAFGNALLDKFAVWTGKINADDVTVHNLDLVNDYAQSSKGCIFLVSHLGNFEICQALASRYSRLKMTVLHHTHHAEKFNRVLRRHRQVDAVEFMQVTQLDVAAGMKLGERLAKGNSIAIAADRVPVDDSRATTKVAFLDANAAFPTGPYVLALATGAPVIATFCIRQNGRYHIYFEQLDSGATVGRAQRRARIEQLAATYAKRLQHYVVLAPFQWFNFYRFWRISHS